MPPDALPTLAVAAGLAGVHLALGRMSGMGGRGNAALLSAAGGISVAYVFVHLLPRLAEIQDVLGEHVAGPIRFLESHAYLLALVGLTVFHGLERHAQHVRHGRRATGGVDLVIDQAAWLHLIPYAVYNAIVGYLLHERMAPGADELLLFGFAMAVHFAVVDRVLREHYGDLYHRSGRFVVAGALLGGWIVSLWARISEPAIGLLLAFLAGSVVLNVLRAEVPADRSGSFWAFAAGAAGYTALLMLA